MSAKGLEAQRNYPLNKKLKEIFWGSWCMQTNWNYERQMNTAFMYGMSRTIDRLYPDADEVEKKKAVYKRHLEFFNITPQCAALVFGICMAMEEEYAEHPDTFDPASISAVKVALMGPLSGIGDALFQGTIRIIAMSIGISLAQQGSIIGPILAALISIGTSAPITWFLGKRGYTKGQEFVRQMAESNLMEKVMFVGSIVGWLVIIPMICLFGPDTWLYPADPGVTISQLYAAGGAAAIWSKYVKYIGAGAIATGGIISLIKSMPLIISTFRDSMKSMKGGSVKGTARTDRDLPMNFILIGIVAMIVIIWAVPAIPVNPLGALLIVIFGFFFATVSSRMVGMIGSSNNPVSGMAIATLLISTIVIKSSGQTGIDGMKAAIAIGSVICIIAAIAGDTSQDLKTGYLLGATPKTQQIGELIGVVASGLAIGGVLYLLDAAWGYGGAEVPAPQAGLMKMIVEGIMGGNLPWALVFIGVFLAIGMEILRIPVMPFAIGLYLPIYLNATIMIGGVVRMFMDSRKKVDEKTKNDQVTDGTLYCAGMIAGEGLVGIALAILAVAGISLDVSGVVNFGNIGGVVLMILMILTLLKFSLWKKKKA